MRTRVYLAAGVVLAGIGGVVWLSTSQENEATGYRLAPVEEGSIAVMVSATGTLGAVGTVEVGSQLSGQLSEVIADFNTEVRKGDVIARLDPETFEARLRQAEAELAIAQAGLSTADAAVLRAQADLETAQADVERNTAQIASAKARLTEAERGLERTRSLFESRVVAKANLETAEANFDQLKADFAAAKASERGQRALVAARDAALRMAEADVQTALAQVQQREAQRDQAKIDVQRTTIRAPVNGVVVERSVDVGQTVAASLQAPTLFTIAEDLRKMEVEVNVDEADIGQVRPGMGARFTVDAYPQRTFSGEVRQIRLAPTLEQNVVTYGVIVTAENGDMSLLPGMTANVQLVVEERGEARKVPNAALRFRPAGDDSPNGAQAATSAAAPGQSRGPGGPDLTERLREAGIALTADQEAQVSALQTETRALARSLRESGAERNTIREQIRAQTEQRLASILTPDQLAAFRAAATRRPQQARQASIYVVGPGGAPEPVPISIGISDGRFTELVDGPLEPGQRVIIGVEARDNDRRRLPRLGF